MKEPLDEFHSEEADSNIAKQPFWLKRWFLCSVVLCLLIVGCAVPFVKTYQIRSQLESLDVDFHTKPGVVINILPEEWVRSFRKKSTERWLWPFYKITYVNLYQSKFNNSHLPMINAMEHLERIALMETAITDDGLIILKPGKHLTGLHIYRQPISDQGLANLQGFTNLESLVLDYTAVTDKGLIHLQTMTRLKRLQLIGNNITDAGLVHLKSLTDLEHLSLDQTRITDAGLSHLTTLKQLNRLNISNTKVTDAGILKLRRHLPQCEIDTGTNWDQ